MAVFAQVKAKREHLTQRSGLAPQRVAGSQTGSQIIYAAGTVDAVLATTLSTSTTPATAAARGSHKSCLDRWRAAVSLGYGPDGKRIRRKVSGQTKQDIKDKLGKLHSADLTLSLEEQSRETDQRIKDLAPATIRSPAS
jgi:hypothetical protein